ncbi:MAG: hypothetical protein IKU30_06590 [Clostridia bacterium]|nr:hypothetical protein [Clostridia bacterium]
MVEDYFQTVFMQWNIKENYSWYSQQETPNAGWEDGIFNNSNEGAIALDDIIFDRGLYENNSLRYAIRNEGCHLTSIAMILANMDQYSDYRYDVRSARSGNIFSDPYVLAMANLNLTDWSTAADGILSGNGNFSNPMLAVYPYIYDVFDITIEKYTQSDGFPTGKRDKAQEITNLLEDYPQGILIRYSGHSAVVVSSTYTASTPYDEIDDCFIVFDPGKSDPADGNYVTIRRSNRSISDIESLYFITAN